MGNSIKPHIENAQKTGVCSLKGLKLKDLPPEFSSLPSTLRTLELSENQLHALPAKIGQFANLKSLSANNNKISTFPVELNNLLKLETLHLSSNLFQAFPLTSASKMKNLKTVNLSRNKLKQLPIHLCQLPNIDALDISENVISIIPDEIRTLKAIELNLNKNRLTELPQCLCECERLKVLRVEENCLSLQGLHEDILKKSNIAVFAFDGNLFDMKQFQDVDGYDDVSKSQQKNKPDINKQGTYLVNCTIQFRVSGNTIAEAIGFLFSFSFV